VIESWAQKTPLIATKVVNPHATVQSEVDGLFIAVDDVDALVEAVQTIKADDQLRDNIIKYGYKHYQTDYSISKVVAQFIDYYHQCLKNGKTTPDKFWLRVLNKLKLKGE
jgi:glycosyltransferase involved in cell wall biosynthesis